MRFMLTTLETIKPVRSTIAVKELPKGVLIEMDCVALANANFHV